MIRKCQVADSPTIQKINQIELGYDYPVEKTAANIKKLLNDPKHHYLWVFEDDNTKKLKGICMQRFLKKPILTVCSTF